jgi:hypothetical protein
VQRVSQDSGRFAVATPSSAVSEHGTPVHSEPVRALGIQHDVILAIVPHLGFLRLASRAEVVVR